jgi:tripartite ATP-independent transporter DctP family solute receptor
VFLALALLVSPSLAAKSIKVHHLNQDDPFDNPTGAMATVFKSLVEAGTNGGITVQTFPNGQLGKDNEVLEQVKSGVVETGIFSVGGFAAGYPLIGVLDVPFAFPNISVTYPVFDGPFGQKLGADIKKKTGMTVLGFGDSGGFFHISNNKKPITSPADVAGLKIRTMGLDTHKAIIQSLGGQPTALAWAEVYTALQTGVADGQMNPIPIIAFAKLQEVQKYLTAPYVWVMNTKFYDGLTADEKKVVHAAATSAIVAGRGIGRVIEASPRGLATLAKTMKVNSLTDEQKKAFRDKSTPEVTKIITQKFGAEGTEMMNAFLAAIKAAE